MRYVIDDADAFGRALGEFRLAQGLSQAEVATRSGLHRTYLSGLERGAATEALRRIMAVAEALDLRITIEGP